MTDLQIYLTIGVFAGVVLLINKMDLLPHLNTRLDVIYETCRNLNSKLEIFEVSATRGDGLAAWFDWLESKIKETGKRA